MNNKIGYIGSKYSLLDFIYTNISSRVELKNKIFCDIFSGTNIVSIFFKDKVKKIITNDLEYYSYVLAKTYLSNKKINQDRIAYLNSLYGIKGEFYNYYCENGKSGRLFFSEKNGCLIDEIRMKIEEYKDDIDEYYLLLTSLIHAADKVANTTSVYSAYLKKLKKSAQKDMVLKNVNINIVDDQINSCYNVDSNELIKKISGDILYIDPPYNHRQYGSNYHILNMIAKYDFTIEPKGVAGLTNYNKSLYCSKVEVKNAFEDLISNANFNHIFISYNNEGILNKDTILRILSKYGDIELIEKEYKTYKADNKRNNKSDNTVEYLFYLKKLI